VIHHLHWSALSSIQAILLASDEAVKGLPTATALNDQVVHGWGATWQASARMGAARARTWALPPGRRKNAWRLARVRPVGSGLSEDRC